MNRIASLALLVLVGLFSSHASAAGLYEDDKNVTKGPLNVQEYWRARWDSMMLDLAIKQHQPEGRIGHDLAGMITNLEDLEKKYPKHEEIKAMKAHAQEIQKKIDPNASHTDEWKPGMPWDDSNFVQLWVNWHTVQELLKTNDKPKARSLMQNVMQNYNLIKPEMIKDYPDDLKKWFDDTKPEAEKLSKELSQRRGR
jgi:hypothetical protein